MSNIDTLLLTSLLGTGLQDRGITDDIMQSESISTILAQLADEFNKATGQIIEKQNQLQQEASQAVKVGSALTDALKDKQGPTPVPQQEDTLPEPVPASQEMPPAPDVGMTPPPEMNVPPAPDMGMQPPAPDAGIPPQPNPDMTQFSPDMIGAVQPRF